MHIPSTLPPTVAFEDIPFGSGGAAVPKLPGRHCAACEHRAKLSGEKQTTGPLAQEPEPLPRVVPVLQVTPPQLMEVQTVKSERMQEVLENRDPNNLNQHVQIVWDDIIGEPEGARSPECAWRLSTGCFRNARNWCYTILAVIFAPPCALLLGCGFACLAFEQIWCTAPCLRCAKIYFASIRTMVQSCMAATVAPTAEAIGHVCRHIRVNFRKDAPEERDMLVV